ncbi:ankyrin repeat and KH domain-containing protein 1-like isoform X8 [Paramormyrops kingsleyae]|uniref:ankyrin repeat and KH domain-containing protein 1-like isoform X8 n=1 Tax=Paramormyrops kingsleyae TaxID=1676925 RepID=UPI003B96B34A
MQDAVAGTAMLTDGFEDEIDSVTPRSPAVGMGVGAAPGVGLGGMGIGGKKVRLFGESTGPGADRLDFKLAAAAVLSSGPGSGSDEDEVSEVESFILDQEDLDNPMLKTASELLLSSATDGVDLRTVDPETQARLEALLEAAGIGKLSTADGKAFADPEVLRRLTSSVSCALDEAAAALTRMRAENTLHPGQADNLVIFSRSLAEACSDGDVNAVRKLLDEGRSVNEHTEEGESLLCLACSAGYYELAQVLLAMHANVEDRGIKGDITPLMAAASGGYVDIVKLLLVHGADVNAQSSTGNTALTYACAGGFVDVVKVLLKEGANIEDHNENGHTPLMEAASAGHVEVARVLLEYGAGINTHSNEFKESALTLACYKGHLDMVRFLLDAGADQEHKTDEMHTALMEACMSQDGHVEVARLLLDSGAQVNMPADSFESPLTLAACGGHVELAALLIERGANLEEVNDEGYTPLMEAAREGHEEMVALLLAQGANINAQTEETQETALTLACCGGFLEVADFLIKAGADIELGCSTPLMEAAQEGHLELVKYLLAAGANYHATTATGDTALTYACENGHTDVADVLLQAGADLEHESEGGRTPLMKAARAGHLCTVQFLISKGANVNRATGNNDHTVVSLACAGGHLAVVELLLAHGADPTHRLKDGSTMLIEAAKGGHTNVVSYLLDYPNNILSVPTPDLSQLTPPSHDTSQVPRVPFQALPMVVPPQEPDRVPSNIVTPPLVLSKAVSSRVPMLSTATSPTPQPPPPTQAPSGSVSPPSMLPIYPSVDIDAHTESNHDTALTLACAGGHEELVSVLIARGANIEHRDKKGFTPLILAATAGHVGVVEVLLDKGGDIEAQSERTKDTPLSLACSGGRQEVVELLLLRGANKEHRNVSDYTPLSLAASGGYVNIIKILLNAGAEINSRTGSKLGISPLMLAAMNGHVPAVKLLLDMGSDINAQIETNRNTALTLACFQGRAEVVSLLLDRKANVEHRAKTGLTPLMEAASGGYAEVGRVLLDKGADVNAPPVPSSRDTALTIAADKGHYKFCELLINRGAHIDVRNKKGNTPLWLAANGGHFDVVQLLVQAGADVDAADNRKITPLMAAFRKGHVKVAQYLVKEVSQFPSDIECMRYIATIVDKDLLKKCHQCMDTIVKAKDHQAAEANKNASILLKELDMEKSREESKKQALAAKREKRKEKRKKKKEEQKRKLEVEEIKVKEEFLDMQDHEKDSTEEPEIPIEPPSATTTTTIGIPATSATFTSAFGKKRANAVTTPSVNRKSKKNKTKDTPSEPIILQDPQVALAQQKADRNKIHGEPRGGGVPGGNSDSDNLDSTDCNSESSSGSKCHELGYLPDLPSSSSSSSSSSSVPSGPAFTPSAPERRQGPPLHSLREEKVTVSVTKPQHKMQDSINDLTPNIPSTFKTISLPVSSPNSKINLTSPKRGQKREEGWKEVVRRSKKLSVPASVVSRIMGRGGCNITAIQDVTGAHIDVDKQKDKNGERMITIRGGTESTRHAVQLINALIQDPAKELEDLIPRNHIRVPGTNSKVGSGFSASIGMAGTSTSIPKSLASMGSSTATSFPPSSSSTLQPNGKLGKGLSSGVRPPFPVSLPLAYAHPQLALLAAQTMHQIRHPRLPIPQFGGSFSPAPNTWGPFPVRPVSPGSANSSPKHKGNPTPRTGATHEFAAPGSNATTRTTTTSTPCSSTTLAQPNAPTSSSVRKQLFASEPKTGNVIPPGANSACTVRAIGTAGQPHCAAPVTPSSPPPPPPIGPPAQQQVLGPRAEPCPPTATPSKERHFLDPHAPVSSSVTSTGSLPFPASPSALNLQLESRQQPPFPPTADLLPAGVQPGSTLPSSCPTPTCASTITVTSNTLPQLSATAPRSSKMQLAGPFFPLAEQPPVLMPISVPQEPSKLLQPSTAPALPQVSSAVSVMNGSQVHVPGTKAQLHASFSTATLLTHFSSMFDSGQVGTNQVWGACHLPTRSLPEQAYNAPPAYVGNVSQPESTAPLPDGSKAPGYRSASQRIVSSPIAVQSVDPLGPSSVSSSPAALTSFAASISASPVFLQGPAPLCTPSLSRQHFSPHPWSASTSCESPAPSASSGTSSPLSASTTVAPLVQAKPNISSQQDRKVPPPIGTERLARIRQTGSINPTLLTTSYSAPVGQGGIWSFGVSSASEAMSGWSQPMMNSHVLHQQLPEPSAFSQHQPMEQDDTGIVAPSNTFHPAMSSSFMDFPKGVSMYGGTMMSPHPPMAEGLGTPIFNGLHTADPAWNPILKVVPNTAENSDPQQVWPGTWAPHVGNVHLNHVN